MFAWYLISRSHNENYAECSGTDQLWERRDVALISDGSKRNRFHENLHVASVPFQGTQGGLAEAPPSALSVVTSVPSSSRVDNDQGLTARMQSEPLPADIPIAALPRNRLLTFY
jgi:hypothetical protein